MDKIRKKFVARVHSCLIVVCIISFSISTVQTIGGSGCYDKSKHLHKLGLNIFIYLSDKFLSFRSTSVRLSHCVSTRKWSSSFIISPEKKRKGEKKQQQQQHYWSIIFSFLINQFIKGESLQDRKLGDKCRFFLFSSDNIANCHNEQLSYIINHFDS